MEKNKIEMLQDIALENVERVIGNSELFDYETIDTTIEIINRIEGEQLSLNELLQLEKLISRLDNQCGLKDETKNEIVKTMKFAYQEIDYYYRDNGAINAKRNQNNRRYEEIYQERNNNTNNK